MAPSIRAAAVAAAFSIAAVIAAGAEAAIIVDTGATPPANSDCSVQTSRSLAGEFPVASGARISSVAGFMNNHCDKSASTAFQIPIHADAAGLPDSSLFAANVKAPASSAGWDGATGIA